ncbi:MAG: hypothetical protein HY818_04115 [Acetobacterium woodii]|nr:hypothetical protein [Acetobacterium woodii]
MDLNAKRDFNVLCKSFRDGSFDVETVSNLLVNIRRHYNTLSEEQSKCLLDLVINVLENDAELKNEIKWAKMNSSYFAKNVTNTGNSKYYDELRHNFESGNYNLDTITELTKAVRNDLNNLSCAVDFLLRIPEVTLRDDVNIFSYSNFKLSGDVFANEINKIMYS